MLFRRYIDSIYMKTPKKFYDIPPALFDAWLYKVTEVQYNDYTTKLLKPLKERIRRLTNSVIEKRFKHRKLKTVELPECLDLIDIDESGAEFTVDIGDYSDDLEFIALVSEPILAYLEIVYMKSSSALNILCKVNRHLIGYGYRIGDTPSVEGKVFEFDPFAISLYSPNGTKLIELEAKIKSGEICKTRAWFMLKKVLDEYFTLELL